MTTPSSAVTVSDEMIEAARAVIGPRISRKNMTKALTAALALPPAGGGEVVARGPCIPVTYCGLATSTHVPLGSDEDHCDLCGHPAQPYAIPPPAPSKVVEEVRRMLAADGKAKFSARNDPAYDEARARLLTALGEAP